MQEFHRADPVLSKLLGPQKLRDGSEYLLSPFTLITEKDGTRWCYSTLTKQGLALPPDFDPAGRYAAARIREDPDLAALTEGWFLKPAERDETRLYEGVAAMMRAFHGQKGLASFVILPTMACNARCTYCYEAGSAPVTMSRETARQTLDFILRSRRPDTKLYIQWFGGEPLLCPDTIDFILNGLREKGVEYRCGFTTNGSLITPALADKMAGDWNLNFIQITLDGAEDSYRRIKRYVQLEDAYGRVLENIGLLTRRGLTVTVRLNFDGTNGRELPRILEDLKAAVPDPQKLIVYYSPLYQLRADDACMEIWRQIRDLSPQIEAAGFRTLSLVGLHTRFQFFRCMAANPEANLLITPEGKLSCCQHQLEGELYGNVREGITRPEALRACADCAHTPEGCRDCPFLPDCTSFHSCPVRDSHCREVREWNCLPQLHALIDRGLKQTAEEEPGPEAGSESLIFRAE